MTQLFDLEDDHLYELWRFTHTYQVVGRCSLRDRKSQREINVVVLSSRCAAQLSQLFIGSKIMGQLGNIPRLSAPAGATGNQGEDGFAYARNDNSAFSKYKRICKKNGAPALAKGEWYKTHRLKNKAHL